MAAPRAKETALPKLTIRLLGRFEVLRDGEPIPEKAWGRRKTKTLLKVLLTDPGRVFTQDQLIDALFGGENVDKATENLYGRVSQLRRALEPGLKHGSDSRYICRKGQGYFFNVSSGCRIDLTDFIHGCEDAFPLVEQGQWPEAIERLESALEFYRGDLHAEDRYEEWTEPIRSELRNRQLNALSDLASCYGRLDRWRQAISCCQRILSIEPFREDVVRQLMEFEHASGHRSRALDAWEQGKKALKEHLDVDPTRQTQDLAERIRSAEATIALNPCRIAVIPFMGIGTDPDCETLADGITEELIYLLSRVAGLEVLAQTTIMKFKGARKSVSEIGQELRAGSVLEGSVRLHDSQARTLVQLIDVENEAHLWSEEYDRSLEDFLGIQSDIAQQVAEVLRVKLLRKEQDAIVRNAGRSLKAKSAYTKGLTYLEQRTLENYQKAIDCFEQAMSIDPDYARAYAGLADAYCLMVDHIPAAQGYPKAETFARKALALDPTCAEAYATLGYISWLSDGNAAKAESTLRKALDINPNCLQAHENLAMLLVNTGRVFEACRQSENALSLSPLSAPLLVSYGNSLVGALRFDEAIEQFRHALELSPGNVSAWWGLFYTHTSAWDWDRAEVEARRIVEENPTNPCAYAILSTCAMNRGRKEEGLELIQRALQLDGNCRQVFVLFHAGMRYYFAREYDKAIAYFQELLEKDPSWNWAHLLIAKCHMYRSKPDYEQALSQIDAAEKKYGGADPFWNVYVHMDRGKIHARCGEIDEAEEELKYLLHSSERGNRHIAISGILAELGRLEESLDWLEKAAIAREPHIASLRMTPDADLLRGYPRFEELLKRVGLGD